MAEHNTLTDPNLHEPKGVSTATSGQVYVADGAGSGTWTDVGTSFQLFGNELHNNTEAAISLVSAATDYKLTNDGAGSFSDNTSWILPSGAVWDRTNDQLDFSGLSIGDSVDIRIEVEYITGGANHELTMSMDLAVGSGSTITIELDRKNVKTASTVRFTRFFTILIGSSNVLNFPAEFYVQSDATGDTAQMIGLVVRPMLRTAATL